MDLRLELRGGPKAWVWLALLCLTGAVQAQNSPRFAPAEIEQGREQYQRSCAQCHGRHMVNSGTTVYDLRKFPTDQAERFVQSLTQGKGNMPAFKDALSPAQVQALWAYVGSRGGKEP